MSTATRLFALSGPTITANSGFLVLGQNELIDIPVPVFLIEHPRGLVLFDTGLAPEAWEDDPRAVYGDLLDGLQIQFPPENSLERQFARYGFDFDDVTHVIVSHSHKDHTGGLYLFPQAELFMSEEDLRYAFWPDKAYQRFFRREDLDRTRSFSWNPLNTDHDLFGDGSIQIIRTPGHTDGQLSLLVKLPSRSFILTGDAVHFRSSMDAQLPCPADMNARASIQSIQRIKRLSASHEADVWVMHDPADWKRFGPVIGGYS
jgi:N-acyl homoserine lactone hydrolase